MRFIEVRKTMFSRDILFCGRRVVTILRLGKIVDALFSNLTWLVGYRELKQHGIELSAGCAYLWTGHYELIDVAVGDLRRMSAMGMTPLGETELVKYLVSGDERILTEYCAGLVANCGASSESVRTLVESSRRLFASLDASAYDPTLGCIVVNVHNGIIDGFHRSSQIYAKHGPEHKIKVLRILPVNL